MQIFIYLLKKDVVVKILMTICMILLVIISFEMIIIIPSMNQDLMVIQQSTAKSHDYLPGYPHCLNIYGIEVTIIKIISHDDWAILGIYRSPKMPVRQLCQEITEVLNSISPENIIVLGDFNVNWLIDTEKRPLYNIQLISTYTTDSKTVIDHIYTNIHVENLKIEAVVLETYFTDHKAVWASLHATKKDKCM